MSNIDWSKLITKEMKNAASAAQFLAGSESDLAARNSAAAAQILRIQDRVDTIGYGKEAGEATEEDVAEQAALINNLKVWKAYKYALGKVATQAAWPSSPTWPTTPAIPEIAAAPVALASINA
ncbi:phage tail protein [Pseudomonas graminis]|uniref:Phage tail protein n=1 Tax=Pseudomonas graminis TaxID=158627 RepID=A0A6M8MWH4_9PSED|nr:phage tail protein [Pseudomonas graminis]QKF52835.1 hypothetical protein FX982_03827 [Pseudomonas graminis]